MEPHSHFPYGPDGEGCYSTNSRVGVAVERAIPGVLETFDSIPFSKKEGPFTICDYGAADGGASMRLIAACIRVIKEKYGDDQEVHVIYNDQPVNDFKSLFKRVHGLLPGVESYYENHDNIFVAAAGTSFYKQIVPSNMVHLGFSSTAFHWLSESPGPLDGAMIHADCENEAQVKVFSEQAASDWEMLLLHRAAELTKGGRLYIVCLCEQKTGFIPVRHLYALWCQMEEEGIIYKKELNDVQLNAYCRVEKEFTTPFTAGNPVHEAGLRILKYEEDEVQYLVHPNTSTQQEGNTDAITSDIHKYVAGMICWTHSSFMSALLDTRSQDDKEKIVDELFHRYEKSVAASPAEHDCFVSHAYMIICKV